MHKDPSQAKSPSTTPLARMLQRLQRIGALLVALLLAAPAINATWSVVLINERTGDVIYTIRISGTSFVPQVFDLDPHTVTVGEPGTVRMRSLTGLEPSPERGATLSISFE